MRYSLDSIVSNTDSILTDYAPSDREINLTASKNSENTMKREIITIETSEPVPLEDLTDYNKEAIIVKRKPEPVPQRNLISHNKNTSANQRTIFPIHNDKNKKGIIDISEPNPILRSKKIETKTENIIAEKPPEKNYYKYSRTETTRNSETKKENSSITDNLGSISTLEQPKKKTVNSVEQKKETNPNSVEPDNNQNQTFLNSERKSKTKQTYTGPEEPTRDYRSQKLCSKNIQDQLEELAIKTNSIPVPEETKTVPITNEE